MYSIKTVAPGTYRVDFDPRVTLGQALAVMGRLDEQTKGRIDWFLDGDLNAFMGRERKVTA